MLRSPRGCGICAMRRTATGLPAQRALVPALSRRPRDVHDSGPVSLRCGHDGRACDRSRRSHRAKSICPKANGCIYGPASEYSALARTTIARAYGSAAGILATRDAIIARLFKSLVDVMGQHMSDTREYPRCGKLAGVAVKTVSRVLNNHPYVSAATKAKVDAAMAELGFSPSIAARILAGTKSGRSR